MVSAKNNNCLIKVPMIANAGMLGRMIVVCALSKEFRKARLHVMIIRYSRDSIVSLVKKNHG